MTLLPSGRPTARPLRSHSESAEKWFYGLAILFGVYLRLAGFWKPSLWLDELTTVHAASAENWAALWQRCRFEFHPPLYYLVVKVFLFVQPNEFFVRLPSLLFGLASIAVLMMAVRRAAGGQGALYAGAIYALNSQAIYYSQEARMYGMALFLAAVSVHAFVAATAGGGRQALLAYALATLLISYTHLIYSSVLAGQIVVALWLFFSLRERREDLRRLLWTQMAVLLLMMPLAPLYVSLAGSRDRAFGWIPPPDLDWLRHTLKWPDNTLAAGVVALALPLVWINRRKLRFSTTPEKALLGLGICYLALFAAAMALARLGLANIMVPRYLLPSLLGIVILLAMLTVKSGAPSLRMILWTYICFLAGFQALLYFQKGPWVGFPQQDWRGAAFWIQARYQPGDVVLLHSGLAPVKTLSPGVPGAQQYLAAPLGGFYDRGGMERFNLPWGAGELETSPFTPPDVRERVRRARQIFVLVNAPLEVWDWGALERWIQEPGRPPRLKETKMFQELEVQV